MTSALLILGKDGQLGQHLAREFPDASAWGRKELDLTQTSNIEVRLRELKPTWVVNASAYTAVDRAESEVEMAFQVNSVAVAELARVCNDIDATLIHFSTDYVFDGTKEGEYLETDQPNPKSVYGRSKLEGERAIAANTDRHWVFRTSWVFSEYSPNFLQTMIRLGRERSELSVVSDQRGKPTYAGELARIVKRVVDDTLKLPPGLHHLACPEATTWFDFANAIFEQAGKSIPGYQVPLVSPISTDMYPTDAERPANSVLATAPEFGVGDWKQFIRRCLPDR